MAVQGSALKDDIYVVSAPESVRGIPFGTLVEPYVLGTIDQVQAGQVGNRFPTPASALGFCIDVETLLALDKVGNKDVSFTNALAPEATHMEPSRGQIWPRIG